TIEYEDNIWQVIEFQHVKPGKGAAFVISTVRNMRNGKIRDKTFREGEKVNIAHIDHLKMQYLYASGTFHAFKDMNTYEQVEIPEEHIAKILYYIKENSEVEIMMYDGEVIGLQLPNNVELDVVETEPGLKGDTASGGSKPATMETGLVVQVPLFINQGETLVINTSDGKYVSRKN